jgi:hypothetical protein
MNPLRFFENPTWNHLFAYFQVQGPFDERLDAFMNQGQTMTQHVHQSFLLLHELKRKLTLYHSHSSSYDITDRHPALLHGKRKEAYAHGIRSSSMQKQASTIPRHPNSRRQRHKAGVRKAREIPGAPLTRVISRVIQLYHEPATKTDQAQISVGATKVV